MKRLLFFCCALLMGGCTLPLQPTGLEIQPAKAQLYHIRLSRWSEPRFSGLLALRPGQDGFSYALLDATGVTLLSARVSESGRHQLLKAYGPFEESSLPGLLSQALFRVLVAQPVELPCSRRFLLRFCYERHGGAWRKKASLGLATMWQVEYDRKEWQEARYASPWTGFGLALQTLPEGRGE